MPAIATRAVRRRILLVEDEAPIRELLRLHLSLAGFDIEEVAEGTAALERRRAPRSSISSSSTSWSPASTASRCAARSGSQSAERWPARVMMLTARGTRGGQGARPRKRRRRLPDQAVQHPRDGGARRRHPLGATSGSTTPRQPPPRRATSGRATSRSIPSAAKPSVRGRARGSDEAGIRSALPARGSAGHRASAAPALLTKVWTDDTYVTERTVGHGASAGCGERSSTTRRDPS